ncbi:6-phosphogluconate dehydrogenase family protein, partial [Trifolium medium]|nr:6-phosphogluconate dehydrogenase family protein [Trifolium medium]
NLPRRTSEPSIAIKVIVAACSKSTINRCPVTGRDGGAENGTLAIFVGGDESIVKITRLGSRLLLFRSFHKVRFNFIA